MTTCHAAAGHGLAANFGTYGWLCFSCAQKIQQLLQSKGVGITLIEYNPAAIAVWFLTHLR